MRYSLKFREAQGREERPDWEHVYVKKRTASDWEHVHVEKRTASEAFQQHQQDWWTWGIIRLGEGRGRRLDEELTLFGYLAHPIGTLPHLLEYNSYSHNLTLKFIRFFLWG